MVRVESNMQYGSGSIIRVECEPTYHRFYSLEPIGDEESGTVLVISVCANCSKAIEYRTNIKGK